MELVLTIANFIYRADYANHVNFSQVHHLFESFLKQTVATTEDFVSNVRLHIPSNGK